MTLLLNKILNFLNKNKKYKIIGLTRIRNEELIIQDSLDSMSKYVDGIIVYDDASTDNTVNICKKHPKVLEIIQNSQWKSTEREMEETVSRQTLLDASKKYNPIWQVYVDADERLEGDIRDFLLTNNSTDIQGIKIRLFDSYITKGDMLPYQKGELWNFRKYFGPEYRDIIMIWKNISEIKFIGSDAREPTINGKIINNFFCQHYGKSLSIDHWEETCDYYVKYFPSYSKKWKSRKGKSVHEKSDFGADLYTWEEVKQKGYKL